MFARALHAAAPNWDKIQGKTNEHEMPVLQIKKILLIDRVIYFLVNKLDHFT